MQLLLSSTAQRTFTGAQQARPRRAIAVAARAEHVAENAVVRAGALGMAITLAVSSATPLLPPAYAEEAERPLTLYERRKLEAERRRAGLEGTETPAAPAVTAAAAPKPTPAAPKPAPAPAAKKDDGAKAAAAAAAAAAAVAAGAAASQAPAQQGGDFWSSLLGSSTEDAKPVAVEEKKAAAAKPALKAAPAVADKKAEPAKPSKRRGPLPLWFTELLLLGAYVYAAVLVLGGNTEELAEKANALAKTVVEKAKGAVEAAQAAQAK